MTIGAGDIGRGREKAVEYALKNTAAGTPVTILNSGSNILSSDNDITVGNWNSALNPPYDTARTPVNALQARSRRTAEVQDGEIPLFLSKFLGWPTMGASKEAVAALPFTANSYVALCADVCGQAYIRPSPRSFRRAF